jgi:hypothetical protein
VVEQPNPHEHVVADIAIIPSPATPPTPVLNAGRRCQGRGWPNGTAGGLSVAAKEGAILAEPWEPGCDRLIAVLVAPCEDQRRVLLRIDQEQRKGAGAAA